MSEKELKVLFDKIQQGETVSDDYNDYKLGTNWLGAKNVIVFSGMFNGSFRNDFDEFKFWFALGQKETDKVKIVGNKFVKNN